MVGNNLHRLLWGVRKRKLINAIKDAYAIIVTIGEIINRVLKITFYLLIALFFAIIGLIAIGLFTANFWFYLYGALYLGIAYVVLGIFIGLSVYWKQLAQDKIKTFAEDAKQVVDELILDCKLNPSKKEGT